MKNISYVLSTCICASVFFGCADGEPIIADNDAYELVTMSPTGGSTCTGTTPDESCGQCADESHPLECGDGVNSTMTATRTLSIRRKWFAIKYRSAVSQVIGKLCIAAPPPTAQTRVYLMTDAAGSPGSVLKDGDLYNAGSGMICTLNAPFDFTAGVEAMHDYWIVSNVDYPNVAPDGKKIPYMYGDADPGYSNAAWTNQCSIGVVVKIIPKSGTTCTQGTGV